MAVNSETNTAYVIDSVKGEVLVIDGETNSQMEGIKLASRSEKGILALNPSTNTIYAISGQQLVIINGMSNTVVPEFGSVVLP